MLVTCGGCGIKFDRHSQSSEFIGSKWYHARCAEQLKKKKELGQYICKLFNLKNTGPMNNAMIKRFVEKNGYTYDGIIRTLKYFYEVKGGKKDNSEERIGIVPFVYEEAQRYYRNIAIQQDKLAEQILTKVETEILVDATKMEQKQSAKQSDIFDLNSLLEEE